MRFERALQGLWAALAASCVPEGAATRPEDDEQVRLPPAAGSSALAAVAAPDASVLDAPFRDDFERAELGPDYHARSAAWAIEEGRLCARGAQNQGAWLAKRLPVDVRIEIDAEALSPEGDIKVELFGDGRSGATGVSYDDATSYIAIFGGWRNTRHVLARLDEHGEDRLAIEVDPRSEEAVRHPVSPGQVYRFRFERRDGKTLEWSIDGVTYLVFPDDKPLRGPGHEHFGVNNWSSPVCFDNLSITPLDPR